MGRGHPEGIGIFMKRNVYLKKKSLDEARAIALELGQLIHLETETVPVSQALGRVLAEPLFAKLSSPPFHCAAMDGIAVKAEITYDATDESPKALRLGEEAFYVNTGNPMPEGTDAVIMIEDTYLLDEERIEIRQAAYPWQHVRAMGEDLIATELALPVNHRITPYDIGALLACGYVDIPVKKKPRVLIVPTGSELVEPEEARAAMPFGRNAVIESNSYVLGGLIAEDGGFAIRHPIVRDDPAKIREALTAHSKDADLILILAGSSAGSEDYTRSIIEESGEILCHGISIMPGKPTMLGRYTNRPVVGIPGYPVSAVFAYEEVVRPLLHRALGLMAPERPKMSAFPVRKIPSKLGVEEFLRVKMGKVGERFVATPLPRGSGMITSLTRADGVVRIPPFSEGLDEGEPVSVELFRPLYEIENTVVMVGSHDLSLDLLANLLREFYPPVFFSSQHVGSLGGILAIKQGVCHMAGVHLLDPETGEYNLPYVRRYLAETPVRIIHLVEREQGLIVPKGNPKGIRGLEDLLREDVRFINRQKGSGTRILLDHELNSLSLDPRKIRGYEKEEFTHMAVASAVLSGLADVAMGILSAARALGLDFVPVTKERYDILIPSTHFAEKRIQKVIETIRSESFKEKILRMGGYDTSRTGEEISG